MGFSKCEKSFVGIFIFSSMFKIRYFYFSSLFKIRYFYFDKKKRMIPITITYIKFYSIFLNLFKSRLIKSLYHLVVGKY